MEVEGSKVQAFEFKLSPKARAAPPARWREAYPESPRQRVDRGNDPGFIAEDKVPPAT